MKRVVKGARDRADIIRRRDEYQSQYDAQKAEHDEQMKNWRQANRTITQGVENEVIALLQDLVEPLDLHVRSEFNWDDTLRVTIESNRNVHNKDKALSWEWLVLVDSKTGQIKKESNSWSGLNAVTEANIESLRLSVDALERLNQIDWATILNKKAPEISEYVTTREPKNRDHEFKAELEMADIEAAMESGGLILGKKNSGRSYRGKVWFVVVGETPKQYKVVEIPSTYVDYVESGADIGTTSTGWVTSTPESISKKWTSIRDIIEWAQNSAMIYNITKEKFFENIEHPVQVLMD